MEKRIKELKPEGDVEELCVKMRMAINSIVVDVDKEI